MKVYSSVFEVQRMLDSRTLLNLYQTVMAAGLTLLLSGCLLLNPKQDLDDFSAYAEKVFKQQNAITDQIMQATDSLNKEQYTRLTQAEMKMHDACQLLNEYALRERDGLDRGIIFRHRVGNSIGDCDRSVTTVQHLLQAMHIEE